MAALLGPIKGRETDRAVQVDIFSRNFPRSNQRSDPPAAGVAPVVLPAAILSRPMFLLLQRGLLFCGFGDVAGICAYLATVVVVLWVLLFFWLRLR